MQQRNHRSMTFLSYREDSLVFFISVFYYRYSDCMICKFLSTMKMMCERYRCFMGKRFCKVCLPYKKITHLCMQWNYEQHLAHMDWVNYLVKWASFWLNINTGVMYLHRLHFFLHVNQYFTSHHVIYVSITCSYL